MTDLTTNDLLSSTNLVVEDLSRELAEALTRTGKWMPGMLTRFGRINHLVSHWGTPAAWVGSTLCHIHLPDTNCCHGPLLGLDDDSLNDPATQGCLWAIVRERWPHCSALSPSVPDPEDEWVLCVDNMPTEPEGPTWFGDTYAEALARAALTTLEGE